MERALDAENTVYTTTIHPLIDLSADDFDDGVDGNDSEMASQNTSDQEDDAMPIALGRGANGADTRNDDNTRRPNGKSHLFLNGIKYGRTWL